MKNVKTKNLWFIMALILLMQCAVFINMFTISANAETVDPSATPAPEMATGKNLFDMGLFAADKVDNKTVTYTPILGVDPRGIVFKHIKAVDVGIHIASSSFYLRSGTYTLSAVMECSTEVPIFLTLGGMDSSEVQGCAYIDLSKTKSATFTLDVSTFYRLFFYTAREDMPALESDLLIAVNDIMLAASDTAVEFVPYGYEEPVPPANLVSDLNTFFGYDIKIIMGSVSLIALIVLVSYVINVFGRKNKTYRGTFKNVKK